MRGLKRKNFWIMEQTAGPGGWGSFGRNPRPGRNAQGRLPAAGARRRRSSGSAGAPAPPAASNTGTACSATTAGRCGATRKPPRPPGEFHRLAKELAGTTVKAEVAMIYDYDSLWALRIQPGFAGNDYHAGAAPLLQRPVPRRA